MWRVRWAATNVNRTGYALRHPAAGLAAPPAAPLNCSITNCEPFMYLPTWRMSEMKRGGTLARG